MRSVYDQTCGILLTQGRSIGFSLGRLEDHHHHHNNRRDYRGV